MFEELLEILLCVECKCDTLSYHEFTEKDGIVVCSSCNAWFPVDEGVLEFLPKELEYTEDRITFFNKFVKECCELNIIIKSDEDNIDFENSEAQTVQQKHFDWYADSEQSYTDYEQTPFWRSIDKLYFQSYNANISAKCKNGRRKLLEVGCAQGRSTFQLQDDENLDIIAFDISKKMISKAVERNKNMKSKCNRFFFVSDATRLPFKNETFDFVFIYGVLHHLPKVKDICEGIYNLLKKDGIYFGSENNTSIFRGLFDLLQKLVPQWYEEAGEEALLSSKAFRKYFEGCNGSISTKTTCYFPPHIGNIFSESICLLLMSKIDKVCGSVPFLKNNGGLIEVVYKKK